eukprot:TRINITY_DN22451_c0_g1_i1.p1 TRINITY_DN22451_c0_g1~~TRINITY_DN22451_c0_g1_i1.p1  ORF type:complete len:521 (+),score=89.42 TRINITY_DN22451_c0_g1_i1:920-2482(+)
MPQLEVFDVSWCMKITDVGVLAVAQSCTKLRTLCVSNTQITDSVFEEIARCQHLERVNASWCLRATEHALDRLCNPCRSQCPPLRELELEHLGAMGLHAERELAGLLPPPPPASPGLWGQSPAVSALSPGTSFLTSLSPNSRIPLRMPPEPPPIPSMLLPPPAVPVTAARHVSAPAALPVLHEDSSVHGSPGADTQNATSANAAETLQLCRPSSCIPPSLKNLIAAYGTTLEHLLIDGIRDAADATALEAMALGCPMLQQLAVTLLAKDTDVLLSRALRLVGAKCGRLTLLRLDSSMRPHAAVVEALALPLFGNLASLSFWCSSKSDGLHDVELETILNGRTSLESLVLRNCESLSEALFPGWCNRGERQEEALAMKQLDEALLFSLSNLSLGTVGQQAPVAAPVRPKVKQRQLPRPPAALALRSVKHFSLSGAPLMSDRSGDALAELLHDGQTVEIRGCPLLTEDTLRSFRKGCRFIRSVCIVMRERTLTWRALTSSVKRHCHRKRSSFASGSSGTESN